MADSAITVERKFAFDTPGPRKGKRPRKPSATATSRGGGRVPRVARLLALAHRIDALVRSGEVADYATVARVGGVSRARVAQVVALVNLAPSIQDAILQMSPITNGKDPISEHDLRPIAAELDWKRQRRMWRELTTRTAPAPL